MPCGPGPAGRFLEGGHPVDLDPAAARERARDQWRRLADEEAASFLAGVLLLRLAEQLSHGDRRGRAAGHRSSPLPGVSPPGRPRWAAHPGAPPGSAGCWRTCGTGQARTSCVAPVAGGGPVRDWRRTGRRRRRGRRGCPPLLSGRRSAACGESVQAAPVRRLRAARGRIAGGRPRPGVAPALGTDAGAGLPDRQADAQGACPAALRLAGRSARVAASACWRRVIDAAVKARAAALRPSYDPRCLTAVMAAVATRMLADDSGGPGPRRVGLGHPAASLAARDGTD